VIIYALFMMVESRTLGGNGRLAWRPWVATRVFKIGELPRLPEAGRKIYAGPGLRMECAEVQDRFGYIGNGIDFSRNTPVTLFRFYVADASLRMPRIYACYDGDLTPRDLVATLQQAGFIVEIHEPYNDQPVAI
jgi:hypothetical protein